MGTEQYPSSEKIVSSQHVSAEVFRPSETHLVSFGRSAVFGIHKKMLNIVILGFGFMCSLGAYQTTALIQTVVLNSVHDEYFQGTSTMGYVSLAIVYGSMGITYLIGPSLAAILGPKTAMVSGAACLTLYIAVFLRPLEATLYVGSALQGFGGAIMWTVQGHFLATNSSKETIGRNTGIFWVLFQSSLVWGNLFYFLMLRGADSITEETRTTVFTVLLCVSALGVLTMACLIHPWGKIGRSDEKVVKGITTELDYFGPKEALKAALRFAVRKDILILIPVFVYMGVELTFWVSVYGTALGYTERFGDLRESLVGLHGVFVGVGQIVGGVTFGLLGGCAQKYGKWQALVFGTAVNLVTFLLAFLNLPSSAPLGMTENEAFMAPNPYVAMLCSTLMGLADAAWNNQLFAYFGTIYPDNCISAFAVFQFWQSVGNASAFGYSTVLQLPYQLLIMAINALVAVVGFFIVDTNSGRVVPKN